MLLPNKLTATGFFFCSSANTVSVVSIRAKLSSPVAVEPSHPLVADGSNFDLSLLRRDGRCGWCRDADVTPVRRGGRLIECG